MGAAMLPRAISDHMAVLFAEACEADPNYLLIFRGACEARPATGTYRRARQESPDIPATASLALVSFRPGDRVGPTPWCPSGALAARGRR